MIRAIPVLPPLGKIVKGDALAVLPPLGKIVKGDALAVLRTWPPRSVHMIVTSPPYFGLRDYGTAEWECGDGGCDHAVGATGPTQNKSNNAKRGAPFKSRCGKCGAVRIDGQGGLEESPDAHVAWIVGVLREARRVLRDDGTLWLNYGDSYASRPNGSIGATTLEGTRASQTEYRRTNGLRKGGAPPGLKHKDLIGMPWRVALALQADGWWLRRDIIYAKTNPMPESVTDRPASAHEYVFLLTKRPRYFYDAEAVREKGIGTHARGGRKEDATGFDKGSRKGGFNELPAWENPAGRNLRSVWEITTQPYSGAHFATFPEKLVEPCIKAGTSEKGACPACGAPWLRVVEKEDRNGRLGKGWNDHRDEKVVGHHGCPPADGAPISKTTGWRPGCECETGEPVPCVVADPFAGSGTAGVVAYRLGREFVGIDLAGGDKCLGPVRCAMPAEGAEALEELTQPCNAPGSETATHTVRRWRHPDGRAGTESVADCHTAHNRIDAARDGGRPLAEYLGHRAAGQMELIGVEE